MVESEEEFGGRPNLDLPIYLRVDIHNADRFSLRMLP
jgi:hypothetical protein